MSKLILSEQASTPSTPAAGKVAIYVDNTATPLLKILDDSGVARTAVTSAAGSNMNVQFNSSGVFAGDSSFDWDNTNKALLLGDGTPTLTVDPEHVLFGTKTSATYVSTDIQNLSAGNSASSDYVATANNGTDSTNYIDLGINSSTYNDAAYNINGIDGGYLYNVGGDLSIGTGTAAKVVKLHTGGTTSNELRATLSDTALTMNAASLVAAAGTTAIAPIKIPNGTNLTTQTANSLENDGVNVYWTDNVNEGRTSIATYQEFKLTATGSAIGPTIANYFGANSNIPLESGGVYEIDIMFYFLKTTAGTLTYTLTNSAAPTSMEIDYEMSPVTGIVAPPGTATMLRGQIYNSTSAAQTIVTASLTTAVNHFAKMKIFLVNSTGTSLKIQATESAGTITPGIGSYWRCRRLSATNVGTYIA